MDCTISEKPAFSIAVIKRKFNTAGGKHLIEIPKWWDDYLESEDYTAMKALTGGRPGPVTRGTMVAVSMTDEPVKDVNNCVFIYGIGAELPPGSDGVKFEKVAIPAATWAVFDCILKTMVDVATRIYTEWFPSADYEHIEVPELEVYFPKDPVTKVMPCQLWIPVVRKR